MRFTVLLIFSFVTFVLVWITINLQKSVQNEQVVCLEIEQHLAYLKDQFNNHELGNRMQAIFPEGYAFAYALYGLSWCELGQHHKQYKKEGTEEALDALKHLNSQQAKSTFQQDLQPLYGIFYKGWTNYLTSKVLQLDTGFEGANDLILKFQQDCDYLQSVFQLRETPYLESYQGQSWPSDAFVAIASLSVHDKVFEPRYQKTIKNWLDKVKLNLDSATGLVAHQTDSYNSRTIEGSRGSSMSLILRMLQEIDMDFGKEQFCIYQNLFVSKALGLPCIREYPKGTIGFGDVDSGPVILGVGFSATIVSIGLFSAYGEAALAERQYKTVNAFGFPINGKGGRRYLMGFMPIADAFIAWGRATGLNYDGCNELNSKWSLGFLLRSFLFLTFIWMVYFRRVIWRKCTSIFRS